jgi:WD40 repeat protein
VHIRRFAFVLLACEVVCANDAAGDEPKPKVEPRLDHFGDPLPPGAVMRLGTVRYRVRGGHRALAFMPDGKTIAARSDDRSILFFDVESGKRVKELRDDDGAWILSYAIAPDGKRIVTVGAIREDEKHATRGVLHIWDTKTLKEIRTIRWPGDEIPTRVFLVADGKIAVTADRAAVRLWDLEGTEALPSHAFPFDAYAAFGISPDGTTIAMAGNGKFDIWEWKTKKAPRQIALGTRDILSLDFSPDGKTLAIGVDYTDGLILLDVATGKRLHTLSYQRTHGTREATFTRDGKYLLVPDQRDPKDKDYSGALNFFEVESGLVEKELRGPDRGFASPTVSPDGKRLAAWTGRIRVWDTATWKEISADDDAQRSMVLGISIAGDGPIVTASYDGIHTWDAKDSRPLRQFRHRKAVHFLTVAPDGKRVAMILREMDEFVVWDVVAGKEYLHLPGHGQYGRTQIAVTADSKRLLSFGHDFFLRVTDLSTGKAVIENAIRPQGVELPDEEAARRFDMLTIRLGLAAFSPDGRRFVWNVGDSFHLFDVETGKERLKIGSPGANVGALAFSADGSTLIATGWAHPMMRALPNGQRSRIEESFVAAWKVDSGESVFSTKVPEMSTGAATFSPDGKIVAIIVLGTKPHILLLTANDGMTLQAINLPSMPGWKLAFTPDSKRIACAMSDSTVLLFDVKPRKGE